MAGRTSTLLNAEKGALLYQNTTTKQQIVTVNAVSNTATANPTLSLVLDTDANRALNFEKTLYSLQGGSAAAPGLIDLDFSNSGANPIYNTQLSGVTMLGTASGAYMSGSDYSGRYIYFDPWMFEKPSEYGNPTDDAMQLAIPYSSQIWCYNDFKSLRAGLSAGDLAGYFNTDGNPPDSDTNLGISYYNAGVVIDHYTNTFFGVSTNAYTTFGFLSNFTGANFSQGNRSSDGWLYNIYGSSWNPNANQPTTRTTSPFLSADGGVFVSNYIRPDSTTNSRIQIMPAGRGYFNTLPTDKTTMGLPASLSSYQVSNAINTSSDNRSYFHGPAECFQWMKYNKANDKYYFCFKHTDGGYAGIYEWEWQDMTSGANNTWGTNSNGPNGNNFWSYTTGSWKRVGGYPLSDSNAPLTQPSKIGANLWVCNSTSDAFYSTDLITWKSSSDYFADTGYSYLNVNLNLAGQKFYIANSSSSVVRPVSGFEEIPAAGRLEYKTAVGNFSRNGLVINPGDCLYAENGDLAASLSISVMYLEV